MARAWPWWGALLCRSGGRVGARCLRGVPRAPGNRDRRDRDSHQQACPRAATLLVPGGQERIEPTAPGHKRTLRHFRSIRPQKRTLLERVGMSALCQKQTFCDAVKNVVIRLPRPRIEKLTSAT